MKYQVVHGSKCSIFSEAEGMKDKLAVEDGYNIENNSV